jgi:hypothetical protein
LATGMATRTSGKRARATTAVAARVSEDATPRSAEDAARLADQVDAALMTLARIGVEMHRRRSTRRGAAEDAAETVREVTAVLVKHQAVRAEPDLNEWTAMAREALAAVYSEIRHDLFPEVRAGKASPADYPWRLSKAFAPLALALDVVDVEKLALTADEIRAGGRAPPIIRPGKTGAIEAARHQVGAHLHGILAKRRHPVTGEHGHDHLSMLPLLIDGDGESASSVCPSTVSNREARAKGRAASGAPMVTETDAREHLAKLARGIEGEVERARK